MSSEVTDHWDPYPFVQDGQPNSPPAPFLTIQENPVIGELLGPNGELIAIVKARATLPFGFG